MSKIGYGSKIGSAEIRVILNRYGDGQIRVFNAKGTQLFSKEATLHSWDNIWNTIRNEE